MSDDREKIFRAIDNALAPLKERTPYPEWEDALPVSTQAPEAGDDLWACFAKKFKEANGTPLKGSTELAAFLRDAGVKKGYCDPAFAKKLEASEALQGVTIETTFDRAQVDTYDFGITLAEGAIAESGTIILTDRSTSSRLAALAPWMHIALIRPESLFRVTLEALQKCPADDPSTVWVTGPSKTADVEGILIEGVHGPGVQIACLLPENIPAP